MTCVDSSFYCKNQTVSPLWPWLPSPKHHFKRGEKQVHFWFLNTCEQFNTNTYQDLENTSRYSWADNHSVPRLFRMASLWDIHAHKGDGRRETGASVCEAEGPWAKHRGRGTPVLCTSLTLTTTVRAATLDCAPPSEALAGQQHLQHHPSREHPSSPSPAKLTATQAP